MKFFIYSLNVHYISSIEYIVTWPRIDVRFKTTVQVSVNSSTEYQPLTLNSLTMIKSHENNRQPFSWFEQVNGTSRGNGWYISRFEAREKEIK